MNSREDTSVTDRIALVLLAAGPSFATGALVWWIAGYFFWQMNFYPPFWPVFVFSALMSFLAVLLKEDLLFGVFSLVWKYLYRLVCLFHRA